MSNTRTKQWLSLVVERDPDHYETPNAYEFSNGRVFKSSDRSASGVYTEVTLGGERVTLGVQEVTW